MWIRAVATAVVLIATVPVAQGCAGTESTPAGTGHEFCFALVNLQFDRMVRCQGASRRAIDAAIRVMDPCSELDASLSAGRTSYDAAEASSCLSRVSGLACGQTITASSAPSCERAIIPKVRPGAACYRLRVFGDLLNECSGGVCSDEAPRGPDGYPVDQCPGVCIPFAKKGEPCGPGVDPHAMDVSCEASLACVGGSRPGSGTCGESTFPEPPDRIGDPCGGPDAIDPMCGGGLVCEGTNGPIHWLPQSSIPRGTCQLARASGPCVFGSDCSTERCVGADWPDVTGSCETWKSPGQPCTAGRHECVIGTYCGAAGTCVDLPSVGQPCAGNAGEGAECIDGYCDPETRTCVAFLKPGDHCEPLPSSGFFPPDPCGGFWASCDRSTQVCVAFCSSHAAM